MGRSDLNGQISADPKDLRIAELERRVVEQDEIIVLLREQLAVQKEQIQLLRDEIARLKGQKPRPKIRPSALLRETKKRKGGKRPGSAKRSKTRALEIHETVVVAPAKVPPGSRFKGYADYTVVGLRFEPHNVCYRLQIWETQMGERLTGALPEHLQECGGHFSPTLVSYIQHQHHHGLVPQGVILEQLHDIGVDLSEGQLHRILQEKTERFHEEKKSLLQVGLEVSPYIQTDDTGARHKGRNGYCTHIGNAWFAYFMSTQSKSRVNFLRILRAGHTDYVLDAQALSYMGAQKLPKKVLRVLEKVEDTRIPNDAQWGLVLQRWGIVRKHHVKIVTEGALLGSVISHGVHPELAVVSDDAGQFDVLTHALCWIHAERLLAKLMGFNDAQRAALAAKRAEVWEIYRDLKAYKTHPSPKAKQTLANRFDEIFQDKTCFTSLDLALARLHRNKSELLLVLDRPDIPLHNNLSENDVREYVMRRKRSGSTRSDLGRRCRDTFASLKKTCRKLGISFWDYLNDRNTGFNAIPQLSELVRQKARDAPVYPGIVPTPMAA